MNQQTIIVQVERTHPLAILPTYGSEGAACIDIRAFMPDKPKGEGVVVSKDAPYIFATGLCMAIPHGWALEIHSRSGQGFNHDTRLSNCTGIIDSDYRGEIMVKLTTDTSFSEFVVRDGDRIAQGKLVRVPHMVFEVVDKLPPTKRGTGGLGSTGKA